MSRPSLVMAQLDAFKEYEGTLQLLNVQDDHHKLLCEFFHDFLLGCPNEEGICRGLIRGHHDIADWFLDPPVVIKRTKRWMERPEYQLYLKYIMFGELADV